MTYLKIAETLRGSSYPKPPTESDLACEEVVDNGKICQSPLVSVLMITYNHADYIAQAVESIVSQMTPFEYEVLVGEDCSTDVTRKIVLELQQKHPEKIRVFISDHNVGCMTNIERLRRRIRGKYTAWCEGDDYWTDNQKLAKQVALIERTNTVVSVAYNHILENDGSRINHVFKCPEVITASQCQHYFHFSTYLWQTAALERAHQECPNISEWYDTIMFPILTTYGNVSVLTEFVSAYRITNKGIATSLSGRGKRIRGIDQNVAMYAYGPKSLRKGAASGVVFNASLYFYLKGSAGSFFSRDGLLMLLLYFRFLPFARKNFKTLKTMAYLCLSIFR